MTDQDVVNRYWDALGEGNGAAMAECYADDATFRDPIFDLKGDRIGAMWRGLMDGKNDLIVETSPLTFENGVATGTWTASYTFRATGRMVINRIDSTIVAKGGKIVAHEDQFPFWKWSRMALGPTGVLLGWTPMVKAKVRKMAAKRIRR